MVYALKLDRPADSCGCLLHLISRHKTLAPTHKKGQNWPQWWQLRHHKTESKYVNK
jgi:hypothetical protein